MIYLNNSATSWPKPQCVVDAYTACLYALPAGQFRSSSDEGIGDVIDAARKKLAALFHAPADGRIIFSSGATESANTVISGLDWGGAHIVSTVTEHNSIIRPLMNCHSAAPETTFVPCDDCGYVSPCDIQAALRPETKAIIVNHCSNVTGAVQNIAAVGAVAAERGILFIVDASQSAGCIPIDIQAAHIDILIFTGHKSLLGVPGTGGMYLRAGIQLRPFKFGGTGQNSARLVYTPDSWEYEPGTQNVPGIAALAAGIDYLQERGISLIRRQETALITETAERLRRIDRVKVYAGKKDACGPVLSFTIAGMSAADAGYILNGSYDIVVRTGLHCAPLMHKALGTAPGGTVRISISDWTTRAETDALVSAVEDICRA
jgi:cysteine desulfurase / selenocysteine lyase